MPRSNRTAHRIRKLLPLERTKVYDMRKIVDCIVDRDSMFELKARYAKNMVTALARIDGHVVGIIANNPLHKGGAIDVDACGKATSFMVLCDSFNIPLVFMVDQPGFLIGIEGERRGAIGRVMNWMNAISLVTVPKFSIIVRKTYGQAVLNMGGGGNADVVLMWPSAEINFMDPRHAVTIVHGVKREEDPEHFDELFAEMAKDTSAYEMASRVQRPPGHHARADPRHPARAARVDGAAPDRRDRRAPDAHLAHQLLNDHAGRAPSPAPIPAGRQRPSAAQYPR